MQDGKYQENQKVVKYTDGWLANMLTNGEIGYMGLYHAIIFILHIQSPYYFYFFNFFKGTHSIHPH